MTQVLSLVNAFDTFISGCKLDGTWGLIKSSCIMAGWNNLSGCLTPLVGASPSGNSLTSSNYNRVLGLTGDGVSFVDTMRFNNSDPQNDKHVSVYGQWTVPTGTFQRLIGMSFSTSQTAIFIDNRSPSGIQTWVNGNNYPTGMIPIIQSGFIGATRSGSAQVSARAGGFSYVRSISSVSPDSAALTVTANVSGYSSFYSIGASLNIALLDNRVTVLMSGIQNAIP